MIYAITGGLFQFIIVVPSASCSIVDVQHVASSASSVNKSRARVYLATNEPRAADLIEPAAATSLPPGQLAQIFPSRPTLFHLG